jgi:aquaporin Z
MFKKLIGECVGSFALVFLGCGSTVLASAHFSPALGIVCQAVAFGLAATTLVYVLRSVSCTHFNPAITVGFAIANRFPVRDLVPAIAAQVGGASAGGWLLYIVASGSSSGSPALIAFGANGYGAHSPDGYQWQTALFVEAFMTFVFVLVNLKVASSRYARTSGPMLIGLSLTLCSLLAVPVTSASMNPARSTATALVVGGCALDQLWLFWAAPLAGGVLAGLFYPILQRGGSSRSKHSMHVGGIGGAFDRQSL